MRSPRGYLYAPYLVSASPDSCDAACTALAALSASTGTDLKECLPEFCPNAEEEKVAATVLRWKQLVADSWKMIVGDFFKNDVDQTKLEKWLQDSRKARGLLSACMQVTEQSMSIIAQDDMVKVIFHLWNLVLFLEDCHLFLTGQMGASVQNCMKLQKVCRQYVQTIPIDIDGWGTKDIEALAASPLLDPASGVMGKILEVTRKDGVRGACLV